ncbi:uncharacterized protein LY89DRAFT_664802 [Mollisia scopiformis]|uniref:Uncharacterized protein n=1 Tax=Mollisia scopiformis TaxID=149040 RepID=A0A194XPF9_MOLSC|nr:uncharacterized protein LY89DRAFT_664802 [Mollisia scopiformis]KUJ21622.1 hypothetical protein LY89DRAFT_664802 [Mollisia scopiformis]
MHLNMPLLLAGLMSLAIASPSLRNARSEDISSTEMILTVNGTSSEVLDPDSIIKCVKDCATIIADGVCIGKAILPPVSPTAVTDVYACVKNDTVGLCNCASCVTGAKALGAFLTKYDICDQLSTITTPPS